MRRSSLVWPPEPGAATADRDALGADGDLLASCFRLSRSLGTGELRKKDSGMEDAARVENGLRVGERGGEGTGYRRSYQGR
ncbi:hypothetical protein ACWCPI_29955 [Streptomyces sp. NPDC001920]